MPHSWFRTIKENRIQRHWKCGCYISIDRRYYHGIRQEI